jgi:hypothetical protein
LLSRNHVMQDLEAIFITAGIYNKHRYRYECI